MKLNQIITFTISTFISLVLLIFCFLRKLLLTTSIPITYSMDELKSFIFLASLTTFFSYINLDNCYKKAIKNSYSYLRVFIFAKSYSLYKKNFLLPRLRNA